MTPEGKVKELIKKFLKKYNIEYRMVIPSSYGNTTGMSDFCCILHGGVWLAIEAKAADKVPTKKQQEFLDMITSAGGIGVGVNGQEQLDKLKAILVTSGFIND